MVDAASLAESGAPEGTVIVAEEQTSGRGRAGRVWESTPYAGLWLSILLRPPIATASIGWLPLLAGTAAVRALRSRTSIDLRLKWPNDIVVETAGGLRKVGGILAERLHGGAVIVGIGINVDQDDAELPPGGTSLRVLGATCPREDLLVALLGALADAYRGWGGGSDAAEAYLGLCVTIGSDVRVEGPAGTIEGTATGLGAHGELHVTDRAGTEHAISAGDVLLVRPAIG